MLFYLIYISKAAKLMQEEDLINLLEQSRTWNKAHDITGMLLYVEGRFLSQLEGRFVQVLEGSEQEVNAIFEKIRHDERHHSLIVLKRAATPERNFNSWSMGFESMELEAYGQVPGYFELDDDFLSTGHLQQSSIPLDFLKSFYATNQSHDWIIRPKKDKSS